MIRSITISLFLFFSFILYSQDKMTDFKINNFTRNPGEVIFYSDNESLKLKVCDPSIIRVISSPVRSFSERPSLSVINHLPGDTSFVFREENDHYLVQTGKLIAHISKENSGISFYDLCGNLLLSEPGNGGRSMQPAFIGGENAFTATQTFLSPENEAIYGLGQYQDGVMDWRNVYVPLKQENITAVMPVYYSNQGYGIFWHNYSLTKVNSELIPLDMKASGNKMETTFVPQNTGVHTFNISRRNINRIEFTIDGNVIYEHKSGVYSESAVCKAFLEAGNSYNIKLESFDNKINPPVSSRYLIPADGKPGERGLKAEYFSNSSLSGEPDIVRVDTSVSFDWGSGSFAKEYRNDNFSVRWTGKLISDKSGKEKILSLTTDDGVRMWIDGKLVIDSWRERGPETDEYI